jgi:hypothetical protein
MEHSKTPWIVGHTSVSGTVIGPADPTDNYGENIGIICDKEHARRIVAAVNATAGITTEELEFAIEENIRLDFTGRAKRINKMEAEVPAINARLLEALKDLVSGTDPYFAEIHGFSEQHDAARAAIAEAETREMKVVVPQQDGSAIEYDNMKEAQAAQVIANLTGKLGDAIKALKFVRSVMTSNGIFEASERLAIEKIDEALKPYDLSQQPTYGTGPMIQERPRPEEPDGPDPCDLARDFNDALQDGDQPTPYDEAKYRP